MTQGISPKVKLPALAQLAIGAVLLVLGAILGDDTLTTTGGALILASGVSAKIGYNADPGEVHTIVGPSNDDLLSPEARSTLS